LADVLCSGSFMIDLIASGLPRLGEPGDLVYAPRGIQLHVGGHAANVATDLAQLGQKHVAAAGCVGDDMLGGFVEEALRESGVEVLAERARGASTAKNVALAVEGEDRRFYAELAANTMLSPGHVIWALEETRPRLLYQGTVGGLRLLDGRLDEVLKRARAMGCLTVVDVVMPQDGGWARLMESLHLIDVLHCNAVEGAELTSRVDPLESLDELMDGGVGLCVITAGSDGLVASLRGMRLRLPAFEVRAVDATGAGDAFTAGVIDALIKSGVDDGGLGAMGEGGLTGVLLSGAAAGACCVTEAGATSAVTRVNVDALIGEQGGRVLASLEWL
jgi:fructokinase